MVSIDSMGLNMEYAKWEECLICLFAFQMVWDVISNWCYSPYLVSYHSRIREMGQHLAE